MALLRLPRTLFFLVMSTEVSDFATRGDSGALVVCTTTRFVLGVVSKGENDRNWIRCVKLQYLTEIETLQNEL